MLKKGFIALGALLVVAASTGITPRSAPAYSLQTDDAESIAAPTAVLTLGQVYASSGYSMTITRAFTEPSPTRLGYTEVRASLSLQNTGEAPIIFSDAIFLDGNGYPDLALRDSVDDTHILDIWRPQYGSAPGADIISIKPDLSARWTIGFQVPTESIDELSIEALNGDAVLASWDLLSAETNVAWDAPTASVVAVGESFAYDTGVNLTATGIGSFVCGDPQIETVSHIMTVTFAVDNATHTDYRWPASMYPDPSFIVQWADGSAATASVETYRGESETLPRASGFGSFIPPAWNEERALVFAAPRDARMVDIDALPAGVYIETPLGETVWVDLTNVPSTVNVSPRFCDLGFQGAPVPYAFAPASKFLVRGEAAVVSDAALDDTTIELLSEAMAGAGLLFDARGDFKGIATADLKAFAPKVTFESRDNATPPADGDGVGIVYWDTHPEIDDFIYFITQSESGLYICSSVEAFNGPITASGADPADIIPTCYPATATTGS
jgi:hypothetical protein